VGDHVIGSLGVQNYAVSKGDGLRKLDLSLAPLPVHLSALGMTGLSAYFGLLDIGRPKAGETVLVSAAAGAVGMVVGQIAKIKGCRAVGIAGGPAKCRAITEEWGFDAAIDYKTEHVRHAVKKHCPRGVDVYFDNVGGDILEAALANLARGARIVLCGAISQYNNTGPTKAPSNYMALLVHRARMEGFVVIDYADRYDDAIRELAGWMREGRLKSREHIVDGLENFPDTFLKLFTGDNTGKLILRVADNSSS
jgi:NADPH-dependent curcumin reductase CurA